MLPTRLQVSWKRFVALEASSKAAIDYWFNNINANYHLHKQKYVANICSRVKVEQILNDSQLFRVFVVI